jgi:hypothetical protein
MTLPSSPWGEPHPHDGRRPEQRVILDGGKLPVTRAFDDRGRAPDRGNKARPHQLSIGKRDSPAAERAEIFGVVLDRQMTFSGHVLHAVAKAEKIAAMLMPKLGGPTSARRLLLTTVTQKTLLLTNKWLLECFWLGSGELFPV